MVFYSRVDTIGTVTRKIFEKAYKETIETATNTELEDVIRNYEKEFEQLSAFKRLWMDVSATGPDSTHYKWARDELDVRRGLKEKRWYE